VLQSRGFDKSHFKQGQVHEGTTGEGVSSGISFSTIVQWILQAYGRSWGMELEECSTGSGLSRMLDVTAALVSGLTKLME
jgi:hypothetical protein